MNKCITCGKDISEKKKYCNMGCYSLSPRLKEFAKSSKLISLNTKNKWAKGHKLPEKCKKTWFKKGHVPTHTNKGNVPWNKGKRNEKIIGEKHHNWKGGVTKLNKLIRRYPEYSIWRLGVFERDKFTCIDCNRSGCYLEAHHITPLSELLKQNNIKNIREGIDCKNIWRLDNGVTLCLECHTKRDKHRRRLCHLK